MKSPQQKPKVSQEEKDAQAAALARDQAEKDAQAQLDDQRQRRGYGTAAFTNPLTDQQIPLLRNYLGA